MKRKILMTILCASMVTTLSSCGAVKADTTYVAEYPDGSKVEISESEAHEIQSIQEELGIIVEEPTNKETTEQEETEEITTTEAEEFNLNESLGKEIEKKHSSLGVEYAIYENGAEIINIENEFAVIPEEIEYDSKSYPVIALGDSFLENVEMTEFQIPSHIKYIKSWAFCGSKIENLFIPETVEYLSGSHTFVACNNLKNITFPAEINTDKEWERTFEGCTNLQEISIPDGVICIDDTFLNCLSLYSIVLPDSLEIIGTNTFNRCANLLNINIPNSVSEIGSDAFWATGLKSINIPENVTTLSLTVFNACTNMEEIIIPDTVTSYGTAYGDFYHCDELKVLKLSNSCDLEMLNKIEAPKLELVIFPDNTEEIDENLFDKVENKGNLTIQVPEKTVQYFQNKFPEVNVIAKE